MTTIIEKQEGILPDFNLERFLEAQKDCYPTVVTELRNGCKQTHWMWFIFPQMDGLGTSLMAKRFAIKSRDEAIAFLKHPILRKRLLECAALLMEIKGKSIHQILGSPDDVKLQSCMTLFTIVKPDELMFKTVLEKYYDNELDQRTMELLNE